MCWFDGQIGVQSILALYSKHKNASCLRGVSGLVFQTENLDSNSKQLQLSVSTRTSKQCGECKQTPFFLGQSRHHFNGNRIRCSYLPCSWVTATWAPLVQAPHAVTQLHGGQLQWSLVPRIHTARQIPTSTGCTEQTNDLRPGASLPYHPTYVSHATGWELFSF